MSIQAEKQAQDHPAYNDALRNAAERAAKGWETVVWWDGMALFVRNVDAKKPPNAVSVCFAQKWDDNTVQLRFSGARSEWVKT